GQPANTYFYPGEKLSMSVQEGGKDQLKLDIRSQDNANKSMGVAFDAPGFGDGHATAWKRVSSIDQFQRVVGKDGTTSRKGNEGGTVIPTATTAIGGQFTATQVLVGTDRTPKSIYEVASPTQVRGKDLADPKKYDGVFDVDVDSNGTERLSITPKKP
ncbi:MAG TPA: hypothetical protein VGO62_15550, partial [Myxococcota bacterium]